MPYKDTDRYTNLKLGDGTLKTMPFVPLPINSSDKYEYWNKEFSRFDKLSQKYYLNPFYDYLILYANPKYVSEFDIPNGALIRIPFPLNKAKNDYETRLKQILSQ